MPDGNNGRTTHEWLRHLDTKLDALHTKLDKKASSERVGILEDRVRHTELKQAGIATAASAVVVWFKAQFFQS